MCRKEKREKTKVARVEEEESDTESESTTSQVSEAETIARIPEMPKTARGVKIDSKMSKRNWEKLTIKQVKQAGKVLPRSATEFEFIIRVNGVKIAAVLDTGSPITILPARYISEVRPKKVIRNVSERQFVDVNGKPIKITVRRENKTTVKTVAKSKKSTRRRTKVLPTP